MKNWKDKIELWVGTFWYFLKPIRFQIIGIMAFLVVIFIVQKMLYIP